VILNFLHATYPDIRAVVAYVASFPHENGGRLGWGIVRLRGGVNKVRIAPIPTFPRRRGKEQFGANLNKSHLLRSTSLDR
jgi:hypothetical protein